VRAACVSRWYSSAPVPASDQPRFINGVVRFEAAIDPAGLLAMLQAMEAAAGRVRGVPDAARTLDLDIIDMGGLVRDAPDPVLPHPRAHVRAFVLWPLRDVAPDWVHPRTGARLGELMAGLPAQDIRAV
jgi:2-amino-4-hydroxy-6-hydroxymethyldihydropteridine diphosphokinase